MTIQVPVLTWLDQADPNAPLALFAVDFSIDPNYQFTNLFGTYLSREIYAKGLIVDNSSNNATIIVTSGPFSSGIQPYQRQAIDLPDRTQTVSLTCASPIAVNLEFYVKKPGPDSINYSGAAAVAILPTFQTFILVGAGIYTPTANVKWFKIRMAGGGGGGGAQGNAISPAGSPGQQTIFDGIVANPGLGGTGSLALGLGGLGGTAGLGGARLRLTGESGAPPAPATNAGTSGQGGNTPFFSGGGVGVYLNTNGNNGFPNTGGGGSGGGAIAGLTNPAAGGGSSEYVELIITNTLANYNYTIGDGGVGGIGVGGTPRNGGKGGSSIIDIEEYYNF